MKIFVAGPFFNAEEIKQIDRVVALCKELNYTPHSPKDENLYIAGETDPQEVFDMDCREINDADFLVAVLDGNDPGTLFECGYAYANNIPIVYVWLTYEPGMIRNMMMQQSGAAICKTFDELRSVLEHYAECGELKPLEYEFALH